jgi:endonuclease/exonuclease/phosphatase family metal-dependent hydrolase
MSERTGNLRIAVYNVQNLFSRPMVFGLPLYADELLAAASRVVELLSQPDYHARFDPANESGKTVGDLIADLMFRTSDVRGFEALKSAPRRIALSDVAEIRVDRSETGSNIFHTREGSEQPTGIKFDIRGRHSWSGAFELRRAPIRDQGVEAMAKVIDAIDADILCLNEVENRRTLIDFAETRLDTAYPNVVVFDGNDRRGIDVAVMTKPGLDIGALRTNVFTRWNRYKQFGVERSDELLFDRDCLEVEVHVRGRPISVLVNHLKSKRGTAEATIASDPRRIDQSREIARILRERYRNPDGSWKPVVVAGDLNENPDRNGALSANLEGMKTSIDPLLTLRAEGLFNVQLEKMPNPNDRFTYVFAGRRDRVELNHIDHLFASKPVFDKLAGWGIDRSGMDLSEAGLPGGVGRGEAAASDHALVWMDLDWP